MLHKITLLTVSLTIILANGILYSRISSNPKIDILSTTRATGCEETLEYTSFRGFMLTFSIDHYIFSREMQEDSGEIIFNPSNFTVCLKKYYSRYKKSTSYIKTFKPQEVFISRPGQTKDGFELSIDTCFKKTIRNLDIICQEIIITSSLNTYISSEESFKNLVKSFLTFMGIDKGEDMSEVAFMFIITINKNFYLNRESEIPIPVCTNMFSLRTINTTDLIQIIEVCQRDYHLE
ncbi:hypothetical protein CDIK_1772 [Cucumispora dikerogammari]|nr:hypothetical protein CDIK_1772 [Cucumispora dikerogammari]